MLPNPRCGQDVRQEDAQKLLWEPRAHSDTPPSSAGLAELRGCAPALSCSAVGVGRHAARMCGMCARPATGQHPNGLHEAAVHGVCEVQGGRAVCFLGSVFLRQYCFRGAPVCIACLGPSTCKQRVSFQNRSAYESSSRSFMDAGLGG